MSEEFAIATPVTLDSLAAVNPLATQQDAFIGNMAAEWLPRLQLNSASSTYGKNHVEHINTFGIVRSETDVTILGKTVTVLPLAWRPLALDTSGDRPRAFYDPASTGFKTTQDRSNVQNSNCMWGAQFLIWIPEAKQFATFYLSSKSSRKLGPSMNQRLNKSVKLGSETIKTEKYTWQNPTVEDGPPFSDMPSAEEIQKQVEQFRNPPAESVGVAAAPADTESR